MTKVVVDLGQLRRTGDAPVLVRFDIGDKATIDDACRSLNMQMSQFVRSVTVQAAEQIMGGADAEPSMDPTRPPGGR